MTCHQDNPFSGEWVVRTLGHHGLAFLSPNSIPDLHILVERVANKIFQGVSMLPPDCQQVHKECLVFLNLGSLARSRARVVTNENSIMPSTIAAHRVTVQSERWYDFAHVAAR
jgi:hypothetical protein